MNRRFSLLISWGCMVIICLTIVAALWSLFNINWFAEFAQSNIAIPIIWATVETWQWYAMWLLTALYLSLGLFALYCLHSAFASIAKGELFNLANSTNLRRFSILLFVQVLAKPLYFSMTSVLLSLHHPAGEKMLSVSFGSGSLMTLGLAMILWVISDLLVMGSHMQAENQQFI